MGTKRYEMNDPSLNFRDNDFRADCDRAEFKNAHFQFAVPDLTMTLIAPSTIAQTQVSALIRTAL